MIALETALSFAWRHWRTIAAIGALAALGFLLAVARGDARHWEKVATQTQAAFDQTVAQYRIASEAAAKLDAQNVARVKAEQATINERSEHEFQARLADSASRYDVLRAKAEGYLGRPATVGLPDTREVTCQSVASTSCAELPRLLKAAQDNTDQLLAVLDWAEAQGAVETNAPPR